MSPLQVYYHGIKGAPLLVGRLALRDRTIYFEYASDFVARNLNLSPINLPLSTVLQAGPPAPFSGLHGVFADSLPDGWGLLLMDRKLRERKIDIAGVTPLDRLAYMGDRAMGALSYRPDTGDTSIQSEAVSLAQLAEESLQVISGSTSEVLTTLSVVGGSPGGARPKAVIGLKGDEAVSGVGVLPEGFMPWLVKFPIAGTYEAKEEGVIEYIYAQMAQSAGVTMAQSRLLVNEKGERYFATRRFDRNEGNNRVHLHSLAGMVNANFRVADCDYETFIKAVSFVTHSQRQVQDAFRAMVFNVLTGNRDDHTKNFSFLMKADGIWELAPIYDVTYSGGMNGEHSMSIAGEGKEISRRAIDRIAQVASISSQQVQEIIEQTHTALKAWQSLADDYGISKNTCTDIASYIDQSYKRISK